MNKKLEINFHKKPEMVFHFDQFLNVEKAVDTFLNKKENLEKLIAPLLPKNLEETIQKLIPEVKNGYTPRKGIDYNDGEDGKTPTDEQLLALIEPRIPKIIPGTNGTTPKKGVDYFTKKELDEIKKALKESILSEIPKTLSKDELTVKFQDIQRAFNNLPIRGASYLRQLMDVKMGTLDDLQYGFTYNKSTAQFTLTQITGGGGSGDVTGPATNTDGYIPLWDGANSKTLKNGIPTSTFEPAKGSDDNYVTDAEKIKLSNLSGTNTGDQDLSGYLEKTDIASGTITARADDINFSGGSDGDVLTVQADGSLALETPSAGGGGVGSMISFSRGKAGEAPANDTVYYDSGSGSATETSVGDICPFAGTLGKLWVDVYINTLDEGSSVFTLMKNGSATIITVTVAFGVTSITGDTTHTTSVSAGDRISLRVANTGTSGGIAFAFSYNIY